MKRERMLEELEAAAAGLRVRVVFERMTKEASPGGLCRVNGEYRVIVDRHAPLQERLGVLVGALARFPTDGVYLSPQLREILERRAVELQADPVGLSAVPETSEATAVEEEAAGPGGLPEPDAWAGSAGLDEPEAPDGLGELDERDEQDELPKRGGDQGTGG